MNAAKKSPVDAPAIKLGDRVKDRWSDDEGTAYVLIRQMNGTRRFLVAMKNKDGERKNAGYDEPELELLESAEEDLTPEVGGEVELGSEVRDTTTGFTGVCTSIYLYLNGCIRYEVQGLDRQKGVPTFVALDEIMVQPTGYKVQEQGPRRSGGAHGLEAMR